MTAETRTRGSGEENDMDATVKDRLIIFERMIDRMRGHAFDASYWQEKGDAENAGLAHDRVLVARAELLARIAKLLEANT